MVHPSFRALSSCIAAGFFTLFMISCGGVSSSSNATQPGKLVITTNSLPSGGIGVAYSSALTASGGTAPYSWTVSSGSLPPGLTLASNGNISGTPTASGPYSFTALVRDSSSPVQSASGSLTLSITSGSSLLITTTSLSSGSVGTAYMSVLSASGGTSPYSWTVSSGNLPPGLTLASGGTISGTPTASQQYNFTVKVADSSSPAQSATRQLSLSITSGSSATPGATATQYVMSYTASNANQCTIEVSANSSYTPLVHAVDPAIFSGANMDGQTNAGGRAFVVGGRWVLQENTNPPSIAVGASSATRSPLTVPGPIVYGSITVTYNRQPFVAGDNITITSMTNPAYNSAWARVMKASTNSFTYWVTASGTDASGGGTITRANRYSMALQNTTTYYYRLGGVSNTCGASPATGTFTTMNWPNGDTFGENFPTDSSGNWEVPSIPESGAASVSVIDPITGTLTKPMSLWSDAGSILGSMSVATGGTVHHCTLQADASGFTHCYLQFDGGSALYGINDSTGESRWLGTMLLTPYEGTGCANADGLSSGDSTAWDPSDPNVFYHVCNGSGTSLVAYKATYTGNDVAVSGNTQISMSATVLTSSLATLISSFDSTYNNTLYHGITNSFVDGDYLYLTLTRWQQASPGWYVIYNYTNNTIVAATSSWANQHPATCSGSLPTPCTGYSWRRWCGPHGQGDIGGSSQGWTGFSEGWFDTGNASMGKFETTLNQGGGLNGTDATDTIAVTSTVTGSYGSPGDPMSQDIPPDGNAYLDQALPGDYFTFTDTGESVQILARNSATSLTVARGCHSGGSGSYTTQLCDGTGETTHSNGAIVYAQCWEQIGPPYAFGDGNPTYNEWNFINDPHGTDVTQTNMIWDTNFITGHYAGEFPWMIDEALDPAYSTTWNAAYWKNAPNYYINQNPTFAGVNYGPCYGNGCEPYMQYFPSDPTTVDWAWNPGIWVGASYPDTATVISSGTGYYIEQYHLYNAGGTQHILYSSLPYFSVTGFIKMQDISGPGSMLQASAAGNNTFCIVSVAGECWAGSSVGDIYANLSASQTGCTAHENGSYSQDWCVNGMPPMNHGVMQVGLSPANSNGTLNGLPLYGMGNSRKLVLGMFTPPRGTYAILQATPLQDWVFWATCAADPYANIENGQTGCVTEVQMAQVPPQPSDDGIDRTNYASVTVAVGTGSGGATHARVKYGFEENEPSKVATWPPAINFYCAQYQGTCYSSDQSLPLNTPQVLQIGVPQRVLFYEVEYLNTSNQVVASDPITAAAIP